MIRALTINHVVVQRMINVGSKYDIRLTDLSSWGAEVSRAYRMHVPQGREENNEDIRKLCSVIST